MGADLAGKRAQPDGISLAKLEIRLRTDYADPICSGFSKNGLSPSATLPSVAESNQPEVGWKRGCEMLPGIKI